MIISALSACVFQLCTSEYNIKPHDYVVKYALWYNKTALWLVFYDSATWYGAFWPTSKV